jgi:hypothetical protein
MDADLQVFTENVKRMVSIQEQLAEIATQIKERRMPLKEALDSTQVAIIDFMKKSNVDVINYQDEKIQLQSVVRGGSLTKKTLKNALDSYFGESPEQAESCFEHVVSSLGSREVDVLKRVRKRAAPKKGAKRTKLTAMSQDDVAPESISDEEN